MMLAMVALTTVRALSLLGASVALLVSVIVGGWDRLLDPAWFALSLTLVGLYVLSTWLFCVSANRYTRHAHTNETSTS